MRAYAYESNYASGNLALALAPALTPTGIVEKPSFFTGFATRPQILARGLLVLADISATRYFKHVPVNLRDPILTAQGDRLRAECFSACNGVYARLDLLKSGFDGEIGFGTTNVDIGIELRKALTQVKQNDKLHVDIGNDGLSTTHFEKKENLIQINEAIVERPVKMPDRWVRALGNASEIHRGMEVGFNLKGPQAQAFIASLPAVTGKSQSGFLTPAKMGVKISQMKVPNSVFVSGLHRLGALKRVLTNITAITFYKPNNTEPGACMVVAEMPSCRITLSLTAEPWHGYSGEGALLTSLAHPDVINDSETAHKKLSFQSIVDVMKMAEVWNINTDRAEAALSLLAVSGKLGYDSFDGAYFHRELPDDPNRVLKDNPRLVAAQKILENPENIKQLEDYKWSVISSGTDYRVLYNPDDDIEKCTCTWYLKHLNKRGPCKHILAVQLKEGDF